MEKLQYILVITLGVFSAWFLLKKYFRKPKNTDPSCGKNCDC